MVCNYVDFQCESFYDGLYELDVVLSSATQIYFHQKLNNAVLYYDHGQWFLNHPNKYRWYTTVKYIFGPEADVEWYKTDEFIEQLATYTDCVSNHPAKYFHSDNQFFYLNIT